MSDQADGSTAASFTRESVHVPQSIRKPGRALEFTQPCRGGLRVDQRGLCAEKRTCQCAVTMRHRAHVKLETFA